MTKDLFSAHPENYARARPTYPAALFDFLASVVPDQALAWDCATGNGQAALPLAERFRQVEATDLSAAQLAQAPVHPRIRWRVAPAEHGGLPDGSTDLVTVAQAYHWFDHEAFHAEVRRVLVPEGLLAVWCYGLTRIEPRIDALIDEFHHVTLARFWEPERRLVLEGYASIPFPFRAVAAPPFEMEAGRSLQQFLDYLGTWSAVQACRSATGQDPVAELAPRLAEAWGGEAERKVRWPLTLRLGRP